MADRINLNLLAKRDPEQSIREHTDGLIMCAKKLEEIYHLDPEMYEALLAACEVHDYGKMNPEFQNRIKNKYHFNPNMEIPHNVLSGMFVDKNEKHYLNILYAVLYHHFHGNSEISQIFRKPSEKQLELLSGFQNMFEGAHEVTERSYKNACKTKNAAFTILLKGLLHRCDYAASAGIEIEYANDYMQNMMKHFFEKYKENALQEFCRKNKQENLIITAPTGMGKTEAALEWIGNNKGIYILPLRSAINAMYDRIKHMIEKEHMNDIHNKIALLYSDNVEYLQKKYDDEIDSNEYRNKTRQFTLPFTVSTPDQLFDFVFGYPGYEMKLATAAYSYLVIDEIQAYDAVLLAYIIYGIHQIMDLGGHVAIFTATLPGFVRNHLLEKRDTNGNVIDRNGYLFKSADFSKEYKKIRHNVKVMKNELSAEDVASFYEMNKREGKSNKILVICNTVIKAQEIYDFLKEELSEEEIKVFHSKFIRRDRAALEGMILKDGKTFNAGGKLYEKNVVWITTQIVEASLDIDFDYLFTELSELNGLFQRFGRVNRKGVKSVENPNCFVYTKISNNVLKKHENGKEIIDQRLYELSKTEIEKIDGIMTEQKKEELINDTFSSANMKGKLFERIYSKTYESLYGGISMLENIEQVKKKFRNIISESVIPESVYNQNKEDIENNLRMLRVEKNNNKRMEIKENILDYTVNVGFCDVGKNCTIKEILVGSNELIKVIKGNYDSIRGFSRLTKEQLQDEENSTYGLDFGVFL